MNAQLKGYLKYMLCFVIHIHFGFVSCSTTPSRDLTTSADPNVTIKEPLFNGSTTPDYSLPPEFNETAFQNDSTSTIEKPDVSTETSYSANQATTATTTTKAETTVGTTAPTTPSLSLSTERFPSSATITTTTASSTGCNTNFTATSLTETFSSPFYPAKYKNNMFCKYRFNVSSTKKRAISNYGVQLVFQTFELEEETYCLYDYIEIYDGATIDDPLIGRYCGTDIPPKVQGTKSSMLVIFSSDDSYSYKGFTTQYAEIDISYPNCKANYVTQITASPTIQTIQNSAYPSTYLQNTDEYFLIINPATVILQLVDMDVERAKGCIYDRIIIYDGGCPSFGILDTHCGTFLKRWELSGSEYLIQFHTDSSIQKTGFKINVFQGVAGTGPPTTTTTTIGPPIEAEILVMDEILTNYSVQNFPSRDLSNPIGTTVDIFLVGINELDEVQQKLTTTDLIDARWQDDFLKWYSSKQGGVIKLLIPQNGIWKPDLALLNGFESLIQFGDKFMYIVVEANGSCQWRPYQILSSTCNIDMTNYPYDTQSCELKFSTWSSRSDQVTTTIGGKGMEKHEYYIENPHWALQTINQRTESIGTHNVVIFSLTLKRNPTFIVFYIGIPVVLLAILNSFTFVLPPASGEKASYSIFVFLSFVVYVIVTYQKMPENSDKISLFAMYVLIMTFISSITVLLTTLELRLMTLDKTSKILSDRLAGFVYAVSKSKQKLFCIKLDTTDTIRRGKAESNTGQGDKLYSWQQLVSAIDFVSFWLFLITTIGLTCTFLIYLAVQ